MASATLDVRSSPAALPWASASSSPGRATIPTRVHPSSELAGRTTTPLRNTFTYMVCRAPSPPRRLALCCVRVSLPRFMAVHYLPVRVVVSRTDRPLLHPPPLWTSCSPWHSASSPSAGAARPTTSALAPSLRAPRVRGNAEPSPLTILPVVTCRPFPTLASAMPLFFPTVEQLAVDLRYSPCSLRSAGWRPSSPVLGAACGA